MVNHIKKTPPKIDVSVTSIQSALPTQEFEEFMYTL